MAIWYNFQYKIMINCCVLLCTHHSSSVIVCTHSVDSASISHSFRILFFQLRACNERVAASIVLQLTANSVHFLCAESSTPRRVLICCIHLLVFRLWTNISHANLFSAIAFTSRHTVHARFIVYFSFAFSYSKEIFFLFSDNAFSSCNFHFRCNGLCAYRTRNAPPPQLAIVRVRSMKTNYGYISWWCRCISFLVCVLRNWCCSMHCACCGRGCCGLRWLMKCMCIAGLSWVYYSKIL